MEKVLTVTSVTSGVLVALLFLWNRKKRKEEVIQDNISAISECLAGHASFEVVEVLHTYNNEYYVSYIVNRGASITANPWGRVAGLVQGLCDTLGKELGIIVYTEPYA